MLCLIIWCLVVLAAFYYYGVKPMSYWKKRGIKQSNPAWVFGDHLDMNLKKEGFTDFINRMYNKYPNERYFGLYQMTTPVLMITDPNLIKQVTVKDFDYFIDHMPFISPDSDLIWRKNLLSLTGQEWREMRSVLSPCFTSSKMKLMFQLVNDLSVTFVQHFKKECADGIIELEMQDAFARFGNDVIASVAFGIHIDSLKDETNKFYTLGKDAIDNNKLSKRIKLFGFFLFPNLLNFLKISFFGKEITDFFTGIVEETIKMREEKGIVRPDMIQLMLEARKQNKENIDSDSTTHKRQMTNLDMAAQAFIFFFAGFDSVTNTMAFMASELAINPNIQKKLRHEIDETNKKCNGQLTYDALMNMKYMDMVISETLRKWPNFPSSDRICTKAYTIESIHPSEKPCHLKKGESLLIPIWSIQRDPKYYPEPEKFDPERFSEENKHQINPSTFLAFGTGPRICIGSRLSLMECKIMFYYLLLNFELVIIAKSTVPKKLVRTPFSVLAEGGHWLGLQVRE